jgi:hypothetical protein
VLVPERSPKNMSNMLLVSSTQVIYKPKISSQNYQEINMCIHNNKQVKKAERKGKSKAQKGQT